MTNNIPKWEERFDEKFKCLENGCDGDGYKPYQIGEFEWSADQCQFHAEYIFPIKSFIKDLLLEHDRELWQKIKQLKIVNCHTDSSIFNTNDYYKKDDILSTLKEKE